MSNALYPLFKQAALSPGATGGTTQAANINLTTDTIKVALVKTSSGYTYSASHQYYSDLTPGSYVVGTPVAVTGQTVTNGVFNASSPVTFSSVTGPAVGALVIYKDTGTAGTSPLIAYFDTATGIPVTPNGGNITITWDSGANKIFAL